MRCPSFFRTDGIPPKASAEERLLAASGRCARGVAENRRFRESAWAVVLVACAVWISHRQTPLSVAAEAVWIIDEIRFRDALDRGDYALAGKRLSELEKSWGNHVEKQQRRARVNENKKNDPFWIHLRYRRAQLEHCRGDYEAAATAYDECLKLIAKRQFALIKSIRVSPIGINASIQSAALHWEQIVDFLDRGKIASAIKARMQTDAAIDVAEDKIQNAQNLVNEFVGNISEVANLQDGFGAMYLDVGKLRTAKKMFTDSSELRERFFADLNLGSDFRSASARSARNLGRLELKLAQDALQRGDTPAVHDLAERSEIFLENSEAILSGINGQSFFRADGQSRSKLGYYLVLADLKFNRAELAVLRAIACYHADDKEGAMHQLNQAEGLFSKAAHGVMEHLNPKHPHLLWCWLEMLHIAALREKCCPADSKLAKDSYSRDKKHYDGLIDSLLATGFLPEKTKRGSQNPVRAIFDERRTDYLKGDVCTP